MAKKRKSTAKKTKKKVKKVKKAKSAKKAGKTKKRPTRRKKKHLTSAEIKHFKTLLLAKYREILTNCTEFEDEALGKSRLDASGDLSSMPIHMADLGTDNYEQEFALGLLDGERRLLREIYEALDRMERGQYGICQGTGKPIPKPRLEAQPWAKYCVEYARKLEQGLVSENDHFGEFDEEGQQ